MICVTEAKITELILLFLFLDTKIIQARAAFMLIGFEALSSTFFWKNVRACQFKVHLATQAVDVGCTSI